MSPEQLNNRAGRERGYTGTAVDVWAAGVWLTVMLVRGARVMVGSRVAGTL